MSCNALDETHHVMEATGRHVHTVISLKKKNDLGIGIDMNLLSTINKILIDNLSTRRFWLVTNWYETSCQQPAAKPFMGLVKMGAGFKLGYVMRDNFSGTPHFETKWHPSGETYQGLKEYHLKYNYY